MIENEEKKDEPTDQSETVITSGEEVYKRPECVFEHCPNPNHCKEHNKCRYPEQQQKL